MKLSQNPAEPVDVPYTDLPALTETYADQLRMMHFDGYAVRLEFVVARHSVSGPDTVVARHVPVARLVLPPLSAAHLHEQLTGLLAGLEKLGVLKRVAPGTPTAQ